jgi:hypothetical protein
MLEEVRIESAHLDQIGIDDLLQVALDRGKEHIYSILSSVSPIQHQAMLAGFGFSFRSFEKNYLFQLHLRNLLDSRVEDNISTTRDEDLKSFILFVKERGRLTTHRRL